MLIQADFHLFEYFCINLLVTWGGFPTARGVLRHCLILLLSFLLILSFKRLATTIVVELVVLAVEAGAWSALARLLGVYEPVLCHVCCSLIEGLLLVGIEGEYPLATMFFDFHKDYLFLKLNCAVLLEMELQAVLERETWEFEQGRQLTRLKLLIVLIEKLLVTHVRV